MKRSPYFIFNVLCTCKPSRGFSFRPVSMALLLYWTVYTGESRAAGERIRPDKGHAPGENPIRRAARLTSTLCLSLIAADAFRVFRMCSSPRQTNKTDNLTRRTVVCKLCSITLTCVKSMYLNEKVQSSVYNVLSVNHLHPHPNIMLISILLERCIV